MTQEPDITGIARAIGDPTRQRMLGLLMEGRALTAKELAYGAGVEPATGTTHLQRLVGEGLVSVRAQGRHKYFRLASAEVAGLIESMMAIAPPSRVPVTTPEPLRHARMCYDHLAGRTAVALAEALVRRRLLELESGGARLTAEGEQWCTAFGIDLAALRRGRRRFAQSCLDWSERREHLGGALGAALAERLETNGWIIRQKGSRAVTVTLQGEQELREQLGLQLV